MLFGETPSQTVGPYLAIGLPSYEGSEHAVAPGTPGAITITGDRLRRRGRRDPGHR